MKTLQPAMSATSLEYESRVAAVLAAQDFQRDQPVQRAVHRPENRALSALAHHRQKLVVIELPVDVDLRRANRACPLRENRRTGDVEKRPTCRTRFVQRLRHGVVCRQRVAGSLTHGKRGIAWR